MWTDFLKFKVCLQESNTDVYASSESSNSIGVFGREYRGDVSSEMGTEICLNNC